MFPFLASAILTQTAKPLLKIDPAKWRLTFQSRFQGSRLDKAKWVPADPWGRVRNQEMEAYVPDAFVIGRRGLSIVARRKPAMYAGAERQYSSGMMTTTGLFSQRFGLFEIRMQVPAGKGLWPAFWLLPEPPSWPPEIDVVEVLGNDPTTAYFTHHWKDSQGRYESDGGKLVGVDLSKAYHTYAVDWERESIKWYLDGRLCFESDHDSPSCRMFMLVNLAVGGDWPDSPDDSTRFLCTLKVRWVRVYQKIAR